MFITDELDQRAPKKTDYLQEKLALQDVAARMADQPEEVLPRFVDLALEMTGGVSAGLSLYEESPPPGVFRWQYLRGRLAPFDGATTPRDFSPCGITLDRNAPVLAQHPERVYGWIADANIVVPEVLLVPLYLGGKVPLGTLWIVSDREGHFDSGHARALTELAAFVGIALRMVRSEHRLNQALEAQERAAEATLRNSEEQFRLLVQGCHRLLDLYARPRRTGGKLERRRTTDQRLPARGDYRPALLAVLHGGRSAKRRARTRISDRNARRAI